MRNAGQNNMGLLRQVISTATYQVISCLQKGRPIIPSVRRTIIAFDFLTPYATCMHHPALGHSRCMRFTSNSAYDKLSMDTSSAFQVAATKPNPEQSTLVEWLWQQQHKRTSTHMLHGFSSNFVHVVVVPYFQAPLLQVVCD